MACLPADEQPTGGNSSVYAGNDEAKPASPTAIAISKSAIQGKIRTVVDYLCWARDTEENAWYRDDLAVAIGTVTLANEDCKDPATVACYEMLGCHPSQVWPRIVEYRKIHLGNLYSQFYDASDNWRLDQMLANPVLMQQLLEASVATCPPKKPAHSVRRKDYPCVYRKSASQSA